MRVGLGLRLGCGFGLELRIQTVEALGILRQLLADVLRAEEDALERAPRALHLEHQVDDRAHGAQLALPLGDLVGVRVRVSGWRLG